ncbi:MAG: alpha/beta hydrolase [Oligoflexales bacterium]
MDLPSSFMYEYEQSFYPRDTGGKTRYIWIRPKKDDPVGLILFSHGMGFDAVYPHLNFFKKALEDGYQIFSYDLDGHGIKSNTYLDANTLLHCLQDAITFVIQRTSLPITLAGMSLGARLSFNILMQSPHPQIIQASLLAMPLYRPSYIQALCYESLTLFSRSFHSQWHEYGLRSIPAFGPFGRDDFPVRTNGTNYVVETLKYIDSHNPIEQAKKYPTSIPIILKYGRWDGIAPVSQGLQLHHALPYSSFQMIHATHLSFPAKASLC